MELDFYIWCLIVGAVLSWLIAFNIVNPYSRFVRTVGDFIARITEPALQRIRKFIPPMGGLDLAPLALIFLIYFIQAFIRRLL
jgi:YggT family protein